MNILLIDPSGVASYCLVDDLKNEGHTVFEAFNLNDAQSIWQDQSIGCIISCVSLAPGMGGLTDKEREESKGRLLAGWVWLRNRVLSEKPDMRHRIILFSGSLRKLKEHIPEEELIDILLISKRETSGAIEKVLEKIKTIKESLERKS